MQRNAIVIEICGVVVNGSTLYFWYVQLGELQNWKIEEEKKMEEMQLSQEAAEASVEQEKARSKAARERDAMLHDSSSGNILLYRSGVSADGNARGEVRRILSGDNSTTVVDGKACHGTGTPG